MRTQYWEKEFPKIGPLWSLYVKLQVNNPSTNSESFFSPSSSNIKDCQTSQESLRRETTTGTAKSNLNELEILKKIENLKKEEL